METLHGWQEFFGIFIEPVTGMAYYSDGKSTGFTFEIARWTGPFNTGGQLGPMSFATKETAQKILDFAKRNLPATLKIKLDEEDRVEGPFTRTIERTIVVSDDLGHSEMFSAGMLANSIIRNGEKWAAQSFKSELVHAGILVS